MVGCCPTPSLLKGKGAADAACNSARLVRLVIRSFVFVTSKKVGLLVLTTVYVNKYPSFSNYTPIVVSTPYPLSHVMIDDKKAAAHDAQHDLSEHVQKFAKRSSMKKKGSALPLAFEV